MSALRRGMSALRLRVLARNNFKVKGKSRKEKVALVDGRFSL